MTVDYAKIFDEYTQPLVPGAVLRRVSEIERRDLQWLWPGRIPVGKLALFAGDPGLGKSFVTLDITARVTRGMKWPDGAANRGAGSVIMLSAEDDPGDTIRPRLEAAGADLTKVHILEAVRRAKPSGDTSLEQFCLETDLLALQDAVLSLSDVQLIVIDPISAYLGDIDSHVNAKVRSLLSPLSEMAAAVGVAIVAVTHLNKNSSSALYRASGSIAFVAAARAVWFFAKDPNDSGKRLILPGKMNLAPDQGGIAYRLEAKHDVAVVAWGETVPASADAVLDPDRAERRSELIEAMDWLRERLSNGPVSQRKIRTEAMRDGFSWATIRRAKDAIGVVSEKTGFQGQWQWCLKEVQTQDVQAHTPDVSTFEQDVGNDELNVNGASEAAYSPSVSTFDESDDHDEVRL